MKKHSRICSVLGSAFFLMGAASAQISGDVIKIGVLDDMSGTYSDMSGPGAIVAAQLAVEDFGGELKGKKIEIVSADHQNKADIAAATARKWIDVDGVDMIVGVGNSSAALAVQEITRQKNVAFIDTAAGSSALTNEQCSPVGIHWTYDTYAMASGTGSAMAKSGSDKWFFLTSDYAFGRALEKNTSDAVIRAGGKIVGAVKTPFPTVDFSSYLLTAQSSGADTLALANAGNDFVISLKQAQEFGLTQSGMRVAGLLVFINEVHSLGLEAAKGLTLTTAWYWDQDEASRAWAQRFAERHHNRMPSMAQAGAYSAVLHYLKAVEAANTDDGPTVVRKMKDTPVQDMFTQNGTVREDGRHVFDMKLVQVKMPEESKGPWDYYKILNVIPADEAFLPLSESACPLVKK